MDLIDYFSKPRFWLYLVASLAVLAFISFSGGLIAAGAAKYLIFFIFSVAYIIVAFVYPEVGLVTIIVAVFSVEYLAAHGLFPQEAMYATDVLVLLLVIRLLLRNERPSGYFLHSVEFKLLLAWLGILLISSVANHISLINFYRGSRYYIRFALLYMCLVEFEWDEKFLALCIKLVTLLVVLQIPVEVVQMMTGFSYDARGGSIGSNTTGLMFVIVCGFLAGLIAYAFFTRRLMPFVAALALLLLPVIGSARIMIIGVPLILIYTFVRLWRHFKTQQVVWVAITVLVLGVLMVNFGRISQATFIGQYTAMDVIRNPRLALQELLTGPNASTGFEKAGRIAGIQLTFQKINESSSTLLFGYGPSSAMQSNFEGLQSSAYIELAQSGSNASQFTSSLVQWGLLGMAIYVVIILILLIRGEQLYRKEQEPFWKAAAFGFVAYSLCILVLSTYTSTWAGTSTSFLFWLFAGILRKRQLEMSAPEVQ